MEKPSYPGSSPVRCCSAPSWRAGHHGSERIVRTLPAAFPYPERTWVLTSYLVANAIVFARTSDCWALLWPSQHSAGIGSAVVTCTLLFSGIAPKLPLLSASACSMAQPAEACNRLSQAILIEAFPAEEARQSHAFLALGIVVAPNAWSGARRRITEAIAALLFFTSTFTIGIAAVIMDLLFLHDPAIPQLACWRRRLRGSAPRLGIGAASDHAS